MTPNEYINNVLKTKSPLNKLNTIDLDVLHSFIGISTEAGELLDIAKKKIFYNKDVDYVNCDEEIGDLLWYIALYLNARGISFEKVMKQNIAKLKARYPDKFTEDAALFRDLEKERLILEVTSKPNPPAPSTSVESSETYKGG